MAETYSNGRQMNV